MAIGMVVWTASPNQSTTLDAHLFLLNWIANPDIGCRARFVRVSSISSCPFLREKVPDISKPFPFAAGNQTWTTNKTIYKLYSTQLSTYCILLWQCYRDLINTPTCSKTQLNNKELQLLFYLITAVFRHSCLCAIYYSYWKCRQTQKFTFYISCWLHRYRTRILQVFSVNTNLLRWHVSWGLWQSENITQPTKTALLSKEFQPWSWLWWPELPKHNSDLW